MESFDEVENNSQKNKDLENQHISNNLMSSNTDHNRDNIDKRKVSPPLDGFNADQKGKCLEIIDQYVDKLNAQLHLIKQQKQENVSNFLKEMDNSQGGESQIINNNNNTVQQKHAILKPKKVKLKEWELVDNLKTFEAIRECVNLYGVPLHVGQSPGDLKHYVRCLQRNWRKEQSEQLKRQKELTLANSNNITGTYDNKERKSSFSISHKMRNLFLHKNKKSSSELNIDANATKNSCDPSSSSALVKSSPDDNMANHQAGSLVNKFSITNQGEIRGGGSHSVQSEKIILNYKNDSSGSLQMSWHRNNKRLANNEADDGKDQSGENSVNDDDDDDNSDKSHENDAPSREGEGEEGGEGKSNIADSINKLREELQSMELNSTTHLETTKQFLREVCERVEKLESEVEHIKKTSIDEHLGLKKSMFELERLVDYWFKSSGNSLRNDMENLRDRLEFWEKNMESLNQSAKLREAKRFMGIDLSDTMSLQGALFNCLVHFIMLLAIVVSLVLRGAMRLLNVCSSRAGVFATGLLSVLFILYLSLWPKDEPFTGVHLRDGASCVYGHIIGIFKDLISPPR